MRGVKTYESMFGNARHIANAVASGLASTTEVRLIGADQASDSDLKGVDLLVAGPPTLPCAESIAGHHASRSIAKDLDARAST